MLRSIHLLIITSLFTSQLAWANPKPVKLYGPVYHHTLNLCSNYRSVPANAIQVASHSANEFLWQARYGLNTKLTAMLESWDFHFALQDCFGNSTPKKYAFMISLISADIAGKAAGSALTFKYTTVAVASWVVSILYRYREWMKAIENGPRSR